MFFVKAEDMLDDLRAGNDLYNPDFEIYVFVYNDEGSICEYDIDNDKAAELANLTTDDDYWGAHLGWGGSIYDGDDALKWCEEQSKFGGWMYTSVYRAEQKRKVLYERMKSEYDRLVGECRANGMDFVIQNLDRLNVYTEILIAFEDEDAHQYFSEEEIEVLLAQENPIDACYWSWWYSDYSTADVIRESVHQYIEGFLCEGKYML